MKKTIKDKVELILQTFLTSRNSDRILIAHYIKYWHPTILKRFDKDCRPLYLNIDDLWTLPSFETIRRIRQKFQEGGKYLSDKKVASKRKEMASNIQYSVNKPNWDQALPL